MKVYLSRPLLQASNWRISGKTLLVPLLAAAGFLQGCDTVRTVKALPIPPERIDCQAATGKRPKLPPEYSIDWTKVASVGQAKAEFDNFKLALRGREKIVSDYVLTLEGELFQCANDDAWLREREAEITR